jgi:hypothetical protein
VRVGTADAAQVFCATLAAGWRSNPQPASAGPQCLFALVSRLDESAFFQPTWLTG